MNLLSRDNFREGVFKRDRYTCVFPGCGKPAEDAHHIIERRLWIAPQEGGYYLNNGASVCEYHHQYGAETCLVCPQTLRLWCNINETIIPKQFHQEEAYDKWGTVMKKPTRTHIKYPSTQYLPNSPSSSSTAQTLPNWNSFLHLPVIATIKMDGGNVCLTKNGVVARNGESANHPSFSLLKERAVIYCSKIPEGIQIFGEWLFARHSIAYENELALENYLQIFSVWDQNKELFLGWDQVEHWAGVLEVPTVPVIGKYTFKTSIEAENTIVTIAEDVIDQGHEGIVLRLEYPFHYGLFEGYMTENKKCGGKASSGTSSTGGNLKSSWHVVAIGKYVRYGHVQTDHTWGRIKNIEK